MILESSQAEVNTNGKERADQQEQIDALAPWFHNLHLPGGLQTAPDHFLGNFPCFKWQQIASHIPADLSGWRVLDIGCNAGFYTIELAKRGGSVLGIDVDPHYLRQAEWAVEQFGVADRVELRRMQVYDLAHETETFDLVLFMGVFYHLRYPLLGLDIVSDKVERLLVFQSLMMPGDAVEEDTYDVKIHEREALTKAGWPKMAFLEHCLAGDPTNWWTADRAGMEALLRSSGLRIVEHPEREIYLCEPDAQNPSSAHTWNRAELLAATGQPWQDPNDG